MEIARQSDCFFTSTTWRVNDKDTIIAKVNTARTHRLVFYVRSVSVIITFTRAKDATCVSNIMCLTCCTKTDALRARDELRERSTRERRIEGALCAGETNRESVHSTARFMCVVVIDSKKNLCPFRELPTYTKAQVAVVKDKQGCVSVADVQNGTLCAVFVLNCKKNLRSIDTYAQDIRARSDAVKRGRGHFLTVAPERPQVVVK